MLKMYKKTISSNNQNTYKFALGLAIIQTTEKDPMLSYQQIGEKIAEYYFKNHFRFKIRETNNPDLVPGVVTLLENYAKKDAGLREASRLTKGLRVNLARLLVSPESGISKSFFAYVLPCWEGAKRNEHGYYEYPKRGENNFFSYDGETQKIILTETFHQCIMENRNLLVDLTILEWVKFLEKFNTIPNLVSKLSPRRPVRRLKKMQTLFENIPLLDHRRCFLCRKEITGGEFSIDHLIPFDYVYADDLWNLVPAHRTCNSSKGNRVGSEQMIKALLERNFRLFRQGNDIPEGLKPAYHNLFRNLFRSEEEIENLVTSTASACKNAGFSQLEDYY